MILFGFVGSGLPNLSRPCGLDLSDELEKSPFTYFLRCSSYISLSISFWASRNLHCGVLWLYRICTTFSIEKLTSTKHTHLTKNFNLPKKISKITKTTTYINKTTTDLNKKTSTYINHNIHNNINNKMWPIKKLLSTIITSKYIYNNTNNNFYQQKQKLTLTKHTYLNKNFNIPKKTSKIRNALT